MPPPTETAPPLPADKPLSIEQRIAAASAPEAPAPVPESRPPEVAHEATRESPEREKPGAAAAPDSEASDTSGGTEEHSEVGEVAEGRETVEIENLDELAAHIGVEVEDLYHIKVPFTEGQSKVEYSIGEWKDKIQAGVDATALAEQRKVFADERKAAQDQLQAQRQQAQAQIHHAAVLTDEAERRLMSDMEGIDWATLRSEDPAEWSAKQQEIKDRQAHIQTVKTELAQQWQTQTETYQADAAAHLQEHLTREREALLVAVPEWRDEGAFESERKSMRDYLSSQGFTDGEISNASDHRLLILARKAHLYDEQKAKTSVAKKRVSKVGKKIVRPGSSASKAAVQQDALLELKSKLRKSGHVNDAADLIAARIRQR